MLPFNSVPKDSFFYDKFEYCIGFFVEEASSLREMNHQHIDKILERRIQHREISQQRWANTKQTILSKISRPILPVTGERLHKIVDILINTKSEYKSVVSIDNMWVYSNDLNLINELDELDYLLFKKYTKAVISRPKNTIIVKNSKFSKRTYLKSIGLSENQAEKLRNCLIRNQQEIRVSPGLLEW